MPVPPMMASIATLIAASALGPLALNIFLPAMPRVQSSLDADYGLVQLTLSVYLLGLAVSQLFYGPLSDRYGRRPPLLVGIVLYILGSLGGLMAPTIEILIAARLVQAVGGCAGLVLGRAIVRDLYSREQSASVLSYVTMTMVVAPMLAPLLGGFLAEWAGWRSTFVATGIAGVGVLALVLLFLAETNRHPRPLPGLAGLVALYRGLWRSRAFRGYAGLTAFSAAGFFSFLGGAPYIVVNIMGEPPSMYGLYFALGAVGYMGGNFLSGRYSVRLGLDRMIGIGLTVSTAAMALMLLLFLAGWHHPLALFLPMTVYALGNGMSLPNGIAGAVSVDPHAAGAASGLSGFLQMGLGAAASMLVGVLVQDNALPMILVMSAAALLALLCYRLVQRRGRSAVSLPASAE